MTKSSKFILCLFVVLSIVPYAFSAINPKCFNCRSDTDPKCADPIDNSTIAIIDCGTQYSSSNTQKPTMCRKTKELVDGVWLYIRDCAVFEGYQGGNDKNECFKSVTNKEVMVCMCNDKDGCNSSNLFAPKPLLLILLVVMPLLKFRLFA